MKIIIPKKELKEALINISKVVTGKSSLPILGAVKISGTGDGVRVTGTNLEQTLTCKIAGGDGEGSFIIDLKELKVYLKQGGTSITVQFEDVGNKIAALFHAGNIPVIKRFKTFPIDEWPELSEIYNRGYKSDTLFAKICDAIPSASKDSTRKILQSVLLESDVVVATNGKELVKLHCNTGIREAVPIPITKFLQSANFAKCSGTIAVQEVNGVMQCQLESDGWIYTTKCIDGNYPNYRHVIPKSSTASIELSGKDMEYLKKGVPLLNCNDEHNTVHLYANHRQVKVLPAKYKGAALTVNSRYKGVKPVAISLNRELLLRAIELGFGKLEFMDGSGFAPITARGNNGDIFIMMPLRSANTDKIINAVKMLDSDKCLSFHGKKPEAEVYAPVTPVYKRDVIEDKQQERSMHRSINKEAAEVPFKKEDKMPEETKGRSQGFQVVRNAEADHFEELLSSIMDVRVKAKEVFDMTGVLSKHVKDAQRSQKAKEREFKHTRDLLGKLKKVSGF